MARVQLNPMQAGEGTRMAKGVGTLMFRRRTGDEVFPLQSATLKVIPHEGEFELLLYVRGERKARGRRVLTNAEVSVFVDEFNPAAFVGRRFEVPRSYDEDRKDYV